MPYVVLSPGPTVNTLGKDDGKEVIQITGAETSTSAGQLRLTTVERAARRRAARGDRAAGSPTTRRSCRAS